MWLNNPSTLRYVKNDEREASLSFLWRPSLSEQEQNMYWSVIQKNKFILAERLYYAFTLTYIVQQPS